MKSRADAITKTSSILAAIISLIIAVCIPAGYFMTAYMYMEGSIDAELEFTSRTIEELVVKNPQSWQFEEIRLQEILERRLNHENLEKWTIINIQGHIIAQTPVSPKGPLVTFSHPVHDSGLKEAQVELNRSIRPLVVHTAFISVCSVLAGIAVFLAFRFFPLRAVQNAYKQLERSEQRLKFALESGRFGVWDWNIKRNVMIWNDRMYDIYGASRDAAGFTMETWQSYLHPQDRARVAEDIKPEAIGEKGLNTEYRITRQDGTVRHIKTDGILLRDEDGKPSRLISLNQDITESRRLEEEREELLCGLKQALLEVKQLSGMLPICSSCKKIRNDDGYWEQIEGYIEKHSYAEFSHGICPECTQKLYPELFRK